MLSASKLKALIPTVVHEAKTTSKSKLTIVPTKTTIKESLDKPIVTTEEQDEKDDQETFSLSLTAQQRKLLMYTGIGIAGYFIVKHLLRSALKGKRTYDD